MKSLSVFSIIFSLFFVSSCTSLEEYSLSCIPNEPSSKLRVCLESGNIQCPSRTEDCYYNLGDFYDETWSELKPFLGEDYNRFIKEDPLITGVFILPDFRKELDLPQCNLPPLPIGTSSKRERHGLDSEKSLLLKQELIYYNFLQAEEDKGITLTKFTYGSKEINNAFDHIKSYYQKRILKSNLVPAPRLEEMKVPVQGEEKGFTRAFVLDHAGALRTLVVEMNEGSILRIRFWKNKLELSGYIEFYR